MSRVKIRFALGSLVHSLVLVALLLALALPAGASGDLHAHEADEGHLHVLLLQTFGDWDAWLKGFSGFSAVREAYGSHGAKVFRHPNDRNAVYVHYEWDGAENLANYFQDPRTLAAIEAATAGRPVTVFRTSEHYADPHTPMAERGASVHVWLLQTFEDYETWIKGFSDFAEVRAFYGGWAEVFRHPDDPQAVYVHFAWEDEANIALYFQDPRTQAAVAEATGGHPVVLFMAREFYDVGR